MKKLTNAQLCAGLCMIGIGTALLLYKIGWIGNHANNLVIDIGVAACLFLSPFLRRAENTYTRAYAGWTAFIIGLGLTSAVFCLCIGSADTFFYWLLGGCVLGNILGWLAFRKKTTVA